MKGPGLSCDDCPRPVSGLPAGCPENLPPLATAEAICPVRFAMNGYPPRIRGLSTLGFLSGEAASPDFGWAYKSAPKLSKNQRPYFWPFIFIRSLGPVWPPFTRTFRRYRYIIISKIIVKGVIEIPWESGSGYS